MSKLPKHIIKAIHKRMGIRFYGWTGFSVEFSKNEVVRIHFIKWFFQIKDDRIHDLSFSERNGYEGKRIGNYCLNLWTRPKYKNTY